MNSIVEPRAGSRIGSLDRALRARMLGQLDGLRHGDIVLADPLGET